MKKNRPNLLNLLLVAGLLVVLPAVFSLLLIVHVFDSQLLLAEKTAEAQIETQARDFLANLDAESLFLPGLRQLGRQLQVLTAKSASGSHHIDSDVNRLLTETAEAAFAEMKQRFDLYLFDDRGTLINSELSPKGNEPAVQYIWNCIAGAEINNDYTGRKADVSQMFGRSFSISRVSRSNDLCFPTFNYGRHGLFYHYHKEGSKNGFIAFTELSQDFAGIITRNLKHAGSQSSALILRNSEGEILHSPGFVLQPEKTCSFADQSAGRPFLSDDHLWKQFSVRGLDLLFGYHFSPGSFRAFKFFVIGIITLLSLYGLIYFYRIFAGGESGWLSIRYKLVGIFLFAVYLPILGLFMLGYNGLRDHRTVLENEAGKGILDVLMEIDSGFAAKEREIFATFERFHKDRSWHQKLSGSWKERDAAIRKSTGVHLNGENFFNWLEIRDIGQNQLYSTSTGEANDRIKAMGRSMSLICLEKVIPERLQQAGIKLKQSDLVLVNLLDNPVLGFSHLFEQPGKMVAMEFEGSDVYWYWNYYADDTTPVAFIGGNSRVQFNALDYLEKKLRSRFNLGNISLRLFAHQPTSQVWLPSGIGEEKKLNNLFKLSSLNDKIETSVLDFAGQRFIAACMPGIKLKDFFIACLYPVAEIDAQIARMWSQINIGVVFILIIAILTGMLLSKAFLKPVSELSLGLKALRKRDTDFRVKISNHDELGELGRTFNQMMAEVKEMLVAGAVQQCLIPAAGPPIPGFESLIYNRMAADVGGDYADMFALPENRFLIVIGDVTGHGVSSSILTAMIKASVFRFAGRDSDLPTMLKNLSIMIFELLKRRKLMTFCATVLDSSSGNFAVANAGHPFPVICTEDGRIREIE
ncbi:MAG: SpoIIE family protein phosphatase, partial [Candidatus Riflebacteria bacterium]|nr:SpoIIE family protein phosphatase [Candidatus Riflebacteria bacterium]